MTEEQIRAIVRDEMALFLARFAMESATSAPPPPDGERIYAFLEGLLPGSVHKAAALYGAFLEHEGLREGDAGAPTPRMFGLRAHQSGLVAREETSGGRRYRRRGGPLQRGCVGAPRCQGPMLKHSGRCAEHQEPAPADAIGGA